MPINEKIRPKKSTPVPRLTADTIPTGNAIMIATAIPPKARANVAPSFSLIKSMTGIPLLNDSPKSKVMRPFRKMPYCTYNGSSNPRFFLTSAIASFVGSPA